MRAFTTMSRFSVAGTVPQTPLSLIYSLIDSVSHPFPPNLQNIINHKSAKKLKFWEIVQ